MDIGGSWGSQGWRSRRLIMLGAVIAAWAFALPNDAHAGNGLKLEKAKKSRVVSAPLRVVAVPRGKPRKVTFFVGHRRVYTATAAPYRLGGAAGKLETAKLKAGRHRVTVRAYYGRETKPRAVASTVIRIVRRKAKAAAATKTVRRVITALPQAEPEPATSLSTSSASSSAAAAAASLRPLLTNDMTLTAESRASLSASWATTPIKRNFPPPSGFSGFTAWGVLDNAAAGNPQPSAKVQIASIDAWLYVKSAKQWRRVQAEAGITDGLFYTDSFDGATMPAGQVASAFGGAAIGSIPTGFNFHFFPRAGRIAFTPGDIGAVVVLIRARLQPGSYDPAKPLPAYTLCAGADWWRSTTAEWKADYSNNSDAGIGRFKRVDANYRLYTMSGGDLTTLPPVVPGDGEAR